MDDFVIESSAAVRLNEMVSLGDLNPPGGGLRLSVKGGGCSGLAYHMEWVSDPSEGDHTYERDGVKVYVDRKSLLFLKGSALVYEGGLMSSGFSIRNPQAKSQCGCGESFSV